LLWLLVLLAALGGLVALLRPSASNDKPTAVTENPDLVPGESSVIASGFAERYVTAYLEAGNEGEVLEPFLGYTPELPPTATAVDLAAPVRAIDIVKADTDYWAVTVAVGWTGQERFWQVAVDLRDDVPNAVGLPAAVAAPAKPERSGLDVNMGQPALNDAEVTTVTEFLGAYLCGKGELARYLSPGLNLTAADPKVCDEVEVIRWGVVEDEDDATQTVVFDAQFDGDGGPRIATYTLLLSSRDGRWEVTDLLPAPPLEDE
jgi:hypothetical protein